MSNVSLTIGGRPYTVACAPGEERHVEALGRSIDGKLKDVPGLSGQSEARTLLFAALLLADELHELRSAAPAPAPGPAAVAAAAANEESGGQEAAEALEIIAERLESLADRLEGRAASA